MNLQGTSVTVARLAPTQQDRVQFLGPLPKLKGRQMPEVNDTVVLKGKTRHGKNRIHQHGERWVVKHLGLFNGAPAMLLRSEHKTDKGDFDGRWVHLQDDNNFIIEE